MQPVHKLLNNLISLHDVTIVQGTPTVSPHFRVGLGCFVVSFFFFFLPTILLEIRILWGRLGIEAEARTSQEDK